MSTLKYPRLTNSDLAELLSGIRVLHYKDYPERLKGEHLPTGNDLLEAVIERLLYSGGDVSKELDFRVKIDLNYLFTHNHDLASYIEEAVLVACDRGLQFYSRGVSEIVPEIINCIKEKDMIAREPGETFVLWVAPNLETKDILTKYWVISDRGDWIIGYEDKKKSH